MLAAQGFDTAGIIELVHLIEEGSTEGLKSIKGESNDTGDEGGGAAARLLSVTACDTELSECPCFPHSPLDNGRMT